MLANGCAAPTGTVCVRGGATQAQCMKQTKTQHKGPIPAWSLVAQHVLRRTKRKTRKTTAATTVPEKSIINKTG